MNRVSISGYGLTKFSRDDVTIESNLLQSTKNLFDTNSNLQQKDIDVVLVSTCDNSKYLAAIISELSGIEPKISHTVENLCNSGTNAIVSAYAYIASGMAEVALVVGAEKYDSPGQILEWDNSRGEFKHPIFWGSIFTKSFREKYGVTDEDFAIVSAKNHNNARENPYAFSNKIYSITEIMNSKKITDELRIFDCSYPCSGSSAILLTSENVTKKYSENPVWVKGIGQKTISAGFTKNTDYSSMRSTIESTRDALQKSHIPIEKVDVAEIHDAFTVCELMALEDIGFSEKGKSAKYVRELYETDNRKINPRGGLIGSGHPLGATGIAQTIEITLLPNFHSDADFSSDTSKIFIFISFVPV